jgi:hypothetical protein
MTKLDTIVFWCAMAIMAMYIIIYRRFPGVITAFNNLVDKIVPIKDKPEIVEVKYLGAVRTDSKRGGLGGAILGGFLFGPLGVPIGGLTPKGTKTLCRFAVRYDDGEMKIQDCYKDSAQYNELMRYVLWDDL